jgi:hypothetical protein
MGREEMSEPVTKELIEAWFEGHDDSAKLDEAYAWLKQQADRIAALEREIKRLHSYIVRWGRMTYPQSEIGREAKKINNKRAALSQTKGGADE